ncbi:shikimate dehydrogenase [Longimicrobium sp.]|uniref:shikimate dehydrogenase family protein n=1 Tax=Longimicrobium sp. TaxID=2029185 RepID=UPI002E309A4C|nr:shikimate dehydrogenase [Longimicrobium sp.]HEX6042745.1 shikimate dehydrogenase [Longimicrobium sp.]
MSAAPAPTPTAGTRLFALLGDPVSHSLSPTFQNAALRALGLDGVYVALRCGADELPGLLRGIARAGGGGNVTVPHKALAAATVERPSDAVRRTGACNAYWLEDGAIHGDNTDVAGAAAAVSLVLGRAPAGARVLLLGAGGAASAVVCALADAGVERIAIANRTVERAGGLAERYRAPGVRIDVADSADALSGERFDLAVNTTSLGLKPGDPLPLDPDATRVEIGAALDVVYTRTGTRWTDEMRARGLPAIDGKEMLIQQGAAAFRRWWGMDPPLDVIRVALEE